MDFATTDLTLAIAHHLLIFALAGIIAFEVATVRIGMGSAAMLRLAKVDLWYGVLAGPILAVGFARANFAAKGWAYYSVNTFFWLKIGTFAFVGVLSIWPTVQFIRWRSALSKDPSFAPDDGAVRTVRRLLWLQVFFFALIPVFAAIMARGYGEP